MELICPSCEARYQVPDGAIGEKGRQVSCMNCGHNWHAYPPLVLGAEATTGIQAGLRRTPRPANGGGTPAPATATTTGYVEAGTGGPPPPREPASRSAQLAEIREMLAEVQSEDRVRGDTRPKTGSAEAGVGASSGAAPGASEAPATSGGDGPAPRPAPRTALETADEEATGDPLRDRLRQHDRPGTGVKEPDLDRMRRRHAKRERQHRRAKMAGSGAFLTGLLLVVIVAAMMVALYLLKPQIVERMPGADPALTEYVETIDSMRLSLAQTVERARDWVVERAEWIL